MQKITAVIIFSLSLLLISPTTSKAQTKWRFNTSLFFNTFSIKNNFLKTTTKPAPPTTLTPSPTNTSPSPNPTSSSTQPLNSHQTPTPTPNPTQSPKPTATPSPTPAPQNTSSSDTAQSYIMSKINQYRAYHNLSSVQADPNTCALAKTRAVEITNSFNHDGFRQRIDSGNLPYDSYSKVTENIAMTSDYKQVVDLWINSSGHAENMRADTPFVCVEQSGNYFAYEGWRP